MKSRLSIIVCAFNEEERTRACLESLFAQDLGRDDYEITFVDDGSLDRTEDVAMGSFAAHPVDDLPTYRYVRIEHAGLCAARNTGLRHSGADLIAFVDADAVAEPDWARRLVEHFEACPETEVCGGRVQILNPESRTASRLDLWHYDESDRRCIIGCNMAFRRQVFDRIGGFRTCFTSRGDETELLMRHGRPERVRKVPQAHVRHERPESLRSWFRERKANGRYYAWGERLTHRGRARWRIAKAIVSRLLTLSPLAAWSLAFLHPWASVAIAPGVLWNVRRQRGGRTRWMFHEARRRHAKWAALRTTVLGVAVNMLGDWCSDWGYLRGALERPGPHRSVDDRPSLVVREIEVLRRAEVDASRASLANAEA
ncbi:MAG: glycosyltransferase family 2 protein [Planctomycetes bacterium]|nr:glycosyltransferase family 2 protein [Planctomycetota bacterium]